jgi:hypothetical protein
MSTISLSMQPVNSELAVDRLSIASFEAALLTRAPALAILTIIWRASEVIFD